MAKPSPDLIKRVMETINTAADAEYFFDQLTSPEWIRPLWEAGMFKRPPEPVRDGTYVQFAFWPESRYLARMAPLDPETVAEVIAAMPDTENMRVLDDLAQAVLAMPDELAARLVPKVSSWLKTPYLMVLPDRVGKLIAKLATAGQVDPALRLTRELLALSRDPRSGQPIPDTDVVLPQEPRPQFDLHEYERILTASLPGLVTAGGVKALDLLCDLLASAIELERTNTDRPSGDYAWIWRKAIEPSNQNHNHGVKDVLVSAVRDAAEQLVGSDPATLDEVVSRLEARPWAIFRRIALHVLRLVAPPASNAIAERLTNTALLYDATLYHEYWLLLRARFKELTPDQQAAVLGAIDAGPDAYRRQAEAEAEAEASEEEIRSRIEAWQWRILAAITDDLAPAWADRYRTLVAPRGEPEHPAFLSYMGATWSGPSSPLSTSQLEAMTTEEIIESLRSWQPSGEWRSPSPEGLGRDLSAVVRAHPSRFAVDAPKFVDCDPTYVRSLFWGLRDAAANGEAFAWDQVLQLARWAIAQPRKIPGRTDEYADLDPGWVWTRKAIADLIGVGLKTGAAEVPYELREVVWRTLEPLTDDEEPTPEYEARYGGSNMDPLTLAINTVRGEAIDAVVHYSLWVHRHLEAGPDAATLLGRGLDEMPEARTVLDRHLDPEHDPSLAIRSIYGRWFPWLALLDDGWTVANLARIFPPADEANALWEAAWEAYVGFCPAYDHPFELLEAEYRRAIHELGDGAPARRQPHGVHSHLADHLMTMYWRGKIGLEPGGLLDDFYVHADDEMRAWALSSVGRALQVITPDEPPTPVDVPPEVRARLITLWQTRLAAAQSAEHPSDFAKEVSEFAWWFTSGVFDEVWALEQLVASLRLTGRTYASHLVLGRLAEAAEGQPLLVIQALQLMIRGDTEGWTVLGWQDELRAVLTTVLDQHNAEANQMAEDVIHDLGARGYRDYRDLLRRGDGESRESTSG